MSTVPTSGISILIDPPKDPSENASQTRTGNTLASWLVGKFTPWEEHRNRGYGARWAEYWRMWRGQWAAEDKNRMSERSRIVAPALAQAIEMTTSEIEEGLFSKDVWFDIEDDLTDSDKLDALLARDTLREDLADVNAQDAVGEAVLNGAIFGTGIIKVNVEVVKESNLERDPKTARLSNKPIETVKVYWESVRPDEFVPDPAGRAINEMLGCFHKVKKPLHYVLDKIEQGVYRKDAAAQLAPFHGGTKYEVDPQDPQNMRTPDEGEEVEIIEYHGKVPVSMMNAASGEVVTKDEEGNVVIERMSSDNPLDAILDESEEAMVEAIVTIANQSILLRAMVNPFVMRDRSVVAFQFEKVPGRFWGRGVAEKGFNPQKALDAEMRARIDALGFISSPMVAVDGGRIPRGFKLEIKPGKVWVTQGPPSEVLMPVAIGQVEPNTFNQTQELERMVQMGTGAFDTATNLKGADANGPQAASLVMGAFVKRAKRAIRSVNDNLVQPLIKKTMWRYMQFAPRRYPGDYKFRVMATMGIVAREVEAMQLTQLMGMMPEQFPQVTVAVAKGIIDLSSLHNKVEVLKAMEQAMAPPSPEEQKKAKALEDLQFQAVQAETQAKLLENQKTIAETRKIVVEALEVQSKADQSNAEVQLEIARLRGELAQIDIAREQNRIDWARVGVERLRVENEKNRPKSK